MRLAYPEAQPDISGLTRFERIVTARRRLADPLFSLLHSQEAQRLDQQAISEAQAFLIEAGFVKKP
jgi:hypothetical protein